MRLLRRLAGPWGRRLLLAFALTAAWAGWMIAPPRPLREWTTVGWLPRGWYSTTDRTGFAYRDPADAGPIEPGMHGPVRLWDLATGRERPRPDADQHTGLTVVLRTAPDGSWLLVARYQRQRVSFAGSLYLWDTIAGRERWSSAVADYDWRELPHNFLVSSDGRFVACRRRDGTSAVLTTSDGQVLFALDDGRPLAFAPDNHVLAALGHDFKAPPTLTLWDMATGRPRTKLTLDQRFAGVVLLEGAATISPDGHWLAVVLWSRLDDGPASKWAELWDLRTGVRAAELDLGGHWDPHYWGLEFSPDGTLLITPSHTYSPRAWDVRESPPRVVDIGGQQVSRSLSGRTVQRWARYPLFSPDGLHFVAPGPTGEDLAFAETKTPERKIIVPQSVWPVDQPDFTPDGRTLAVQHLATFLEPWENAVNWLYQTAGRAPRFVGEEQYEFVFVDVATGAVRGHLRHFPADTHLICFGPDGSTVWTFTYTLGPPRPGQPGSHSDGTLRVQEWAVPTCWPPAWLLAVTAIGVLLAVADWRRSRRPAPGGPTP